MKWKGYGPYYRCRQGAAVYHVYKLESDQWEALLEVNDKYEDKYEFDTLAEAKRWCEMHYATGA